MQKIFLIIVCVGFAFASCKKTNRCFSPTTTAPQQETDSIKHFLDTSGITATLDSRGFYYKISDIGTGDKPTQCSTVSVDYVGRLTNGTVFDRSSMITSFPLGNVIVGWQEAMPLIASGGKMTIYIPPTLGYGASTSNASIPANSILIFDVTLVRFN